MKLPIASKVPFNHLRKVAKQLAEVLFQLCGLHFDHLGQLWCSEDCDKPPEIIPVGPNNARPPSLTPQTSLEWFYAHRQDQNRRSLKDHSDDPEWRTACWVLKTAVPYIINEDRVHGPFPLCHVDLHHGNLLFDDDFNLKGVIDWSQAQTVPIERLVVSPEFIPFPAGSPETNTKILTFRSYIREHLQYLEKTQCLADKKNSKKRKRKCTVDKQHLEKTKCAANKVSPTLLSHIFGSKPADITHRCTYSLPHRAVFDGKLVAHLIYGDNIKWEQLVRVYGEMKIY